MAKVLGNKPIVALICEMVATPKNQVIRLAGAGNARPTAMYQIFLKPPLNWSTPPAANQQLLPADEAIFLVSNDPLHAMRFTDKNNGAAQLSQLWLISGSPDTATINVSPGQTPNLSDDLFCSIPNAGARAFHGPRLYAEKFKGKYYLWCDAAAAALAGNNLVISTGAVAMAAGDAVTVSIYRLNEGDEITVQSTRVPGPIAAATPVVTLNLPAADWYRVELLGDDENVTATLTFTISNNSLSEIVCCRALPDLTELQMNLVQGIRVSGAAAHGINLVSDQNATGSWVGDQPESMVLFSAYLRGIAGNNGFQKLSGQKGNEVMELKKYNPYGFVTPEDNDDWTMSHPFTFNATSQVTNVQNKALDKFHYVIFYLKSGGTGAGADASRNVQLEFFYSGEYTSDGQWPQSGVSPATEDDVAAATKVLASIENVTHNPGFKDIMASIGKYVRLSAPVLALLGPYGKAASIAATGVGEGLGMAFGYKSRTKKKARPEPDEAGDEARAGRFQKVEVLAHNGGSSMEGE